MTYTIVTVTAMLVLGGTAVGNALTLVSAFLLIYILFLVGLKSTFFPDYLNSAFLFAVILIFVTILF
jgi:hypothetical protein